MSTQYNLFYDCALPFLKKNTSYRQMILVFSGDIDIRSVFSSFIVSCWLKKFVKISCCWYCRRPLCRKCVAAAVHDASGWPIGSGTRWEHSWPEGRVEKWASTSSWTSWCGSTCSSGASLWPSRPSTRSSRWRRRRASGSTGKIIDQFCFTSGLFRIRIKKGRSDPHGKMRIQIRAAPDGLERYKYKYQC